jgi:hypothetical protein
MQSCMSRIFIRIIGMPVFLRRYMSEVKVVIKKGGTLPDRTPMLIVVGGTGIEPVTSTV